MDKDKHFLGVDCGSVSLKLVIMNGNLEVLWFDYQRTYGEPLKRLKIMLEKALSKPEFADIDEFAGVYTTGSGRFITADVLNGKAFNEITTHGQAGAFFYPQAKTIIEIGGQDSKLILLDQIDTIGTLIVDSQMNDICAAGTGSFLDQQAFRMGITTQELSNKAILSENPAKISGRCSVFAKTDLIHLQQEGTSIKDLAAGLCWAVARTYIENLIKGREIKPPVLFQGGVARNEGVRKAFLQLLNLDKQQLIIPRYYHIMGAIGAVICGLREYAISPITKNVLMKRIKTNSGIGTDVNHLPTLSRLNIVESKACINKEDLGGQSLFLGVDVGSVSAKVVAINSDRRMVFKYYTETGGDPLNTIRICFDKLKTELPENVQIKGVGVTGSGRDYISKLIKADIVKNEITAQAKGVLHLIPDVNTIIEIGGQDSKYIRVENGAVVDFAMNKTCAAGTGSFLAEQADRLKVELKQFSQLALNSDMPLDMGTRCTVFMETDCIHHQQNGRAKEDILAGLSYSIAKNYLEKVVGEKPIEGKIAIQGGVAFNLSVVSAFSNILNNEIVITPHHEVTGALGMAILASEAFTTKSSFIGFDISNRVTERQMTQCKDCSNLCDLIIVKYDDGDKSVHGSICGKFDQEQRNYEIKPKDYFKERHQLLQSFSSERTKYKGKIGIPRILLFHELYPMWTTFFDALGYEVILSGDMSKRIYEKGLSKVLVDTCYPIRCAYGAVIDVMERGADFVFLPYVLNMPDEGYPAEFSHNCQYVQQLPDLIRASVNVNIITHTVRMKDSIKRIERTFIDLAEQLGESILEARIAFNQALSAQRNFEQGCKQIGLSALNDLPIFDKALVLIGHPYILHDKFFNLSIAARLIKAGIPVIPGDILPLAGELEYGRDIDLCWKTNNRAISIINFILNYNKTHANSLFPVFLTQFGCGADSMLTPYLRDMLDNNPWLELEVDEHNSATGLMTRCEAFWDSTSVQNTSSGTDLDKLKIYRTTVKEIKEERRKIYILPICEAMYTMPEVLRRHNIECEMIAKTSIESNNLGRLYANEKHCRTCQVILGDFLNKVNEFEFDPNKAAFFMFDYDEACRLALFKSLYSKVLRENTGVGIKMLGPTVDDPLEWIDSFGLIVATELWEAIIAGDILSRYHYQLRPYEKEKGAIDQSYDESCTELYEYIRAGKTFKGLRSAMERMSRVPLVERDLVHIGIIGDAFTRVHEYGMAEIFKIIEEMNGVVMLPPSWHDFVNYGSEVRVGALWDRGIYGRSLATKIGSKTLDILKKRLQNISNTYSPMFDDPDNDTIRNYARNYTSLDIAPVIPSMFIGKTVDFVEHKGVHGLVNAFGFNCCLGKITTACIQPLRISNHDIPMFTFIDDGLQQTNIRTRVEAFMEQAWAFKNKRTGKTNLQRKQVYM